MFKPNFKIFIIFILIIFYSCNEIIENDNDEKQKAEITINIGDVDSNDPEIMKIIGVISGPLPCYKSSAPDLTKNLNEIGVNSIRNNDYYDDRMDIEFIFNCCNPENPWDLQCPTYPSWEGCNPNVSSNYNWSTSDELYNSWVDGGFEPFLRVGGEYQCGGRNHDHKGPQNSLQEDNWITAGINQIKRYKNWNSKKNAFSYVDIWTEWPNSNFYDRDNINFIRFWAKAFKQIKSAFPNLKVGGPGFVGPPVIDVKNGKKSLVYTFLKYLYENNIQPDWLGWHFWGNEAEDFIKIESQFRDLLNGKGDFSSVEWSEDGIFKNTELIVDAYGYSKTYMEDGELKSYPREEINNLCNRKKGASILTSIWIALQHTDVQRTYYYRAGDPSSDPNADWRNPEDEIGDVGLFYGDKKGTFKPTAHSIRLWSKLSRNYSTKLKTNYYIKTSDEGKLWVLAGKNNKNDFGILITNVSETPHTYTINFDSLGKTLNDFDKKELYIVNDNENGKTSFRVDGSVIEISPYETHLLILE